MKPKIFIPQPIPEPAIERLHELAEVDLFTDLHRRITTSELLARVGDKEILFALGQIPYDKTVIEAAPNLRLIAAMHSSAKFVDINTATARGIVVTGIPADVVKTTAEFTFASIMGTSWRLAEADRFLRSGRWAQNQSMAFLGSRLFGKTLGIVGLGEVGKGVARRARACDMTVIYNKRNRLSTAEEATLGVTYRDLESLFADSDVVVLTLTLNRQTEGLVNERLISLMKPTAILINTSRGKVLDEAALERALREERLAGAGLDVYEREIPESNPGPRPGLLELPNVLLTPHIGTAARETRLEMANRAVDNIAAFLEGERPPDVLNRELYGEPPRPDDRTS